MSAKECRHLVPYGCLVKSMSRHGHVSIMVYFFFLSTQVAPHKFKSNMVYCMVTYITVAIISPEYVTLTIIIQQTTCPFDFALIEQHTKSLNIILSVLHMQ